MRLRNGTSLLVLINEHFGRVLMYMGDLDPRITYLLRILLGPDDEALDIGERRLIHDERGEAGGTQRAGSKFRAAAAIGGGPTCFGCAE